MAKHEDESHMLYPDNGGAFYIAQDLGAKVEAGTMLASHALASLHEWFPGATLAVPLEYKDACYSMLATLKRTEPIPH